MGRVEPGAWSLLKGEELAVSLLEQMLAHEQADRPPAAAILKHPLFWSKVQYSKLSLKNGGDF
jgi:hypothetical protein